MRYQSRQKEIHEAKDITFYLLNQRRTKNYILKYILTMHVVRDTMRIDKDDRLFSEEDKFCYGLSVIRKRILAVWSKYVSKSKSKALYSKYASIFTVLDELDNETNRRCFSGISNLNILWHQMIQSRDRSKLWCWMFVYARKRQ